LAAQCEKPPKVVQFLVALNGPVKIGYNFWWPKETAENMYISSATVKSTKYIRGRRKPIFFQ
jgi:hypothetical protein